MSGDSVSFQSLLRTRSSRALPTVYASLGYEDGRPLPSLRAALPANQKVRPLAKIDQSGNRVLKSLHVFPNRKLRRAVSEILLSPSIPARFQFCPRHRAAVAIQGKIENAPQPYRAMGTAAVHPAFPKQLSGNKFFLLNNLRLTSQEQCL